MTNKDLDDRLSHLESEVAAIRTATPAELEERMKGAQAALTALTVLGDSAKATAVGLAATLADAQGKQAEIAAVATQAVAAKTQIADLQAIIATKSDHIQNAQEHADKVRADLDRTLTAAQQQATATEGHKKSAQSAAETGNQVLAEIRSAKSVAEAELAAAAAARRQAEEATTVAKALADKSATVEARIATYEKELEVLRNECAASLKTIVALLPGATAAGLAHAFDVRRQSFLTPASRWQWMFIGSLLAIVFLTGSALWHVFQVGTPPSYDELIRMWLARLPVMIALIWLALHSSHEAALAKRLEEDYGYKAAIASCFEGFKKQMSEVGTNVPADSPLALLLENTLKTIAAPPGRIYDKHSLAATPADEARQATRAIAETITKGK